MSVRAPMVVIGCDGPGPGAACHSSMAAWREGTVETLRDLMSGQGWVCVPTADTDRCPPCAALRLEMETDLA